MSAPAIDTLSTATAGKPEAPVKHSRVAERVTVNLSDKSSLALSRLAALTGDTKTDAINKALQVYALIQDAQSNDGEVWLKESAKSDLSRIRFY